MRTKADPTYPEYRSDLDRTLESELLGERLFSVAARFARSRERREKWLRLCELETQTLARVVAFLGERKEQATAPALTRLRATIFGAAMGLLPWSFSMRLLEDGTGPFLEVFERLARHAAPDAEAFTTYLVAHERAIARFARLERNGESARSLEPVLDLLESA